MPPDPLSNPLAVLTDHPVLSPQQETDLIETMLAGAHARAVLPATPPRARAATEDQARRGAEARATLVRHNLRLVVSVAKKYLRAAGPCLTLDDLVSFRVFGLIQGLDKFDPDKGQRLSTYVTWWIRQAIGRGIAEEGRVIDLPVHIYERLHKQRRVRSQLAQLLGREPSAEELATALGWQPKQVRKLDVVTQELLSLNVTLRETDDRTELGDLVPDERFDPEASALASALRRDLAGAMERRLTEREQRLVRAYFGLDSGEPQTLEGVGQAEGVTRERVRQLIGDALKKLRADRAIQDYRTLDAA